LVDTVLMKQAELWQNFSFDRAAGSIDLLGLPHSSFVFGSDSDASIR
jgi:hypothetical protein